MVVRLAADTNLCLRVRGEEGLSQAVDYPGETRCYAAMSEQGRMQSMEMQGSRQLSSSLSAVTSSEKARGTEYEGDVQPLWKVVVEDLR